MENPQQIEVRALTPQFLDDVIRIHLAGLGYTMNSRLGADHLRYLYLRMADNPLCFVGIALAGRVAAGVISGTTDADRLRSQLLRSMNGRQVAGILGAFVAHPSLVVQWLQELVIAAPLRYRGEPIQAELTTLAVDTGFRNRGAGRELVRGLEAYFASRAVAAYRLETMVKNEAARQFYKKLGFEEAGRRAGSYVLVKAVRE